MKTLLLLTMRPLTRSAAITCGRKHQDAAAKRKKVVLLWRHSKFHAHVEANGS